MTYKQTRQQRAEVARALGADAIVEGSCQRAGDRVLVMVQLVDPATQRALWAESYRREFSGVLALQSQIARHIADAIGASVTAEERRRLDGRARVTPDALEAYLRGTYHLQRFTRRTSTSRSAISTPP